MIITYEGEDYAYDLDEITLRQAMAIEKHAGRRFSEWAQVLSEGGDLKAMQAVGWLLLTDGDLDTPIADVDFKLTKLARAFAAAAASLPAPEPADPTIPAAAPEASGADDLSALSLPAGS